jgi:hypothetical protein
MSARSIPYHGLASPSDERRCGGSVLFDATMNQALSFVAPSTAALNSASKPRNWRRLSSSELPYSTFGTDRMVFSGKKVTLTMRRPSSRRMSRGISHVPPSRRSSRTCKSHALKGSGGGPFPLGAASAGEATFKARLPGAYRGSFQRLKQHLGEGKKYSSFKVVGASNLGPAD